ncbi:hypothetical protein [Pantoea ananatis]|uniref:hypothetical protein n=1 Tax=Pantoea ananas TaxID=553 RepID=UPI001B30BCD2|nr:hypothetical protein [Pantoea ananatis]
MKEPIFKTVMPDGRIAVTLLVPDVELANTLFKMAKEANIEVVEAEKSTVTKTLDRTNQEEIFKRISEIAKSLEKTTKIKSLNERLGDFLNKDK